MTDEEYYNSLTGEEQSALNRYKSDPFKLNKKLRKKEYLEVDEQNQVEQLDSAIRKYTSEAEIIVFRGFSDDDLFDDSVNSVKIFPAFTSTTSSRAKACEFACSSNDYGKPILLELKIPTGCMMALMEGNDAFHDDEKEVLLPRNSAIKIITRELIEGHQNILALDGEKEDSLVTVRTLSWKYCSSQLKQVLYLYGEIVIKPDN